MVLCIPHYMAVVVLVFFLSLINTWKAPLIKAVMYSYVIIGGLHRQQQATEKRFSIVLGSV